MTPVKTPRVFYGWWIVGASVIVSLYTAGAVFYGFTAIWLIFAFIPLVPLFVSLTFSRLQPTVTPRDRREAS